MNRIQQLFNTTKANIAYLTAGDGGIEKTFSAAMALIAGGVNLLEIGVPFSDPIADGPVIQRAAARALKIGVTLNDILQLTQRLRQHTEIPLILFSYYNPILSALQTDFIKQAKNAGIDGVLLVDCPFEEAKGFHHACLQANIAPIYVVTPSTSLERVKKISRAGRGFLYYACQLGTTGIREKLPEDFIQKILAIKQASILPVVVGFGISNASMVQQVHQYADGAVIGSLFVKTLEAGANFSDLESLAQQLFLNEVKYAINS